MFRKILYVMLTVFLLSGCNNDRNEQEVVIPEDKGSHYKKVDVEWPGELGLQEGSETLERDIGVEYYDGNVYFYTEDVANRQGEVYIYEFSKETLKWVKVQNPWSKMEEYLKNPDLFEYDEDLEEFSRTFVQKIWHGTEGEIFYAVTKTTVTDLDCEETTKILCLKNDEVSEVYTEKTSGKDPIMAIGPIYENRYLVLSYTDNSIQILDMVENAIKAKWEGDELITGLRVLTNGFFKGENDEITCLDVLTWEEIGTLKIDGADFNADSADFPYNTWEVYEGEGKIYCITKDGVFAGDESMVVDEKPLIEKDVLVKQIHNIKAFFVDEEENVYVKYKYDNANSQSGFLESFDKFTVYVKES